MLVKINNYTEETKTMDEYGGSNSHLELKLDVCDYNHTDYQHIYEAYMKGTVFNVEESIIKDCYHVNKIPSELLTSPLEPVQELNTTTVTRRNMYLEPEYGLKLTWNDLHSDLFDFAAGKPKICPWTVKEILFIDSKLTKIFWIDGTSTMCKVQKPDKFSKEQGILECIYKKMNNNEARKIKNKLKSKVDDEQLHDILVIQSAVKFFDTYNYSSDLKLLMNKSKVISTKKKGKK